VGAPGLRPGGRRREGGERPVTGRKTGRIPVSFGYRELQWLGEKGGAGRNRYGLAVGPTGGYVSEQALEEQFSDLLEHYRGERGALVPLLQGAQAIFGWLPEDVMARVAEAAGEPLSMALGVATFYSQFRMKPHAKNTIRCCHGTACHVSGAPLISREVERYLGIHAGENTEDMLFTIEEVHCVGACGMAPVVMINDRAYGKLTPDKAAAVVGEFATAELAAAELAGSDGGLPAGLAEASEASADDEAEEGAA
jgi:NADH-quinone oxidoreductase subunit E